MILDDINIPGKQVRAYFLPGSRNTKTGCFSEGSYKTISDLKSQHAKKKKLPSVETYIDHKKKKSL